MAANLTNIGEEYVLKNDVRGSFSVLLYNDATDGATDSFDISNLTTEPTDGFYSRQSTSFTASNPSGNWQIANSSDLVFNVTDTTGSVDAYAIVANFTSAEAGDGSATDHIIVTGALSMTRDLTQIDTLTLSSGGVGFSIN